MVYLKRFPNPLLQDLVNGRWLPIIGAGFSSNAVLPAGGTLPLWDGLGRSLASEMPDYAYSGPLDALSTSSHLFSKAKLVEQLHDLLHVEDARPGQAHQAFCSVPFDVVCTTNFDFLLERQYDASMRYCRPVLDEDQLSTLGRIPGVTLLKLHGDLHHPQRLVATEEDYDIFLENHPLIATYLANLMMGRTVVLIGYSMDDPDLRQLWQIITERLGRLRRHAYALLVDAKPTETTRFERRGVKVISLPGRKTDYGEILAATLNELRSFWSERLSASSLVTEQEPLVALSLPSSAAGRICFFAVTLHLQPFYREQVFPIAQQSGFVPVTASDVIVPGENTYAKIDMLLERAAAVVVDVASAWTYAELRLALSKLPSDRILVVGPSSVSLPEEWLQLSRINRPDEPFAEDEKFIEAISSWYDRVAKGLEKRMEGEAERLLRLKEYRAAVISAFAALEAVLRQRLTGSLEGRDLQFRSVSYLLDIALKSGLLSAKTVTLIREWLGVRNVAVHTQKPVPARQARTIVEGISEIIRSLRR